MKKRILAILLAGTVGLGLLAGCGAKEQPAQTDTQTDAGTDAVQDDNNDAAQDNNDASGDLTVIKIGATPSPHAEILQEASKLLEAEGYTLDIVEFVDYVQPNEALNSGDLEANYFQHLPYLEQFNEERGLTLTSAAAIHYEPFGIYPGKASSLEDLEDGAKVAVPNDATNEARALLLLEAQGLIKLKEGVGLEATKKDIEENEKNLDILEIEAAQIPHSLADVDIAVINGNYALEAGLNINDDALATEDSQSVGATTYANIVAVREGDESNDGIQALVKVLQSDEIKTFIEQKYEGAVVPLF